MNPVNNATVKAKPGSADDDRNPLSFPTWNEALAAESLDSDARARWKFAVIGLLKFCKSDDGGRGDALPLTFSDPPRRQRGCFNRRLQILHH